MNGVYCGSHKKNTETDNFNKMQSFLILQQVVHIFATRIWYFEFRERGLGDRSHSFMWLHFNRCLHQLANLQILDTFLTRELYILFDNNFLILQQVVHIFATRIWYFEFRERSLGDRSHRFMWLYFNRCLHKLANLQILDTFLTRELYILFDNNTGLYVPAYIVVLNSSPVSLPLSTNRKWNTHI